MSDSSQSQQKLPSDDAEFDRLMLMGEMLPEIAHEIRNLMQVVSGFIEIELKRSEFSETTRRRLVKSLEHANFASELTGNLLRFARPRDEQTGNPEEALNVVVDLFRHRQRNGLPIEMQVVGVSSAVTMPTSYLQLIFANIIRNAFDAMDRSSGGRIVARVETENDRVRIIIFNSGPHIPAEILPNLFAKFSSGKASGNGLGLHVVHRLVTQAGGVISVENVSTGGVSFAIQLPLAPSATVTQVGAPTITRSLDGARLMIIDDDQLVRDVLQLMIAEIGGSVVQVCGSGDDALKVVEQTPCDVVLLDLRMKGLSGREVYEHLAPQLRRRVVFVTGENLDKSSQSFLKSTAQPVLLKPVKLASLLEAVQKVQLLKLA